MSEVKVNSLTVISVDELDQLDDVKTSSNQLANKADIVSRDLLAMLKRAGISESRVQESGGAGRQMELFNLAGAMWLSYYFAEQARDLGREDSKGGFSGKAAYWAAKVKELREAYLTPPVAITLSADTSAADLQETGLRVVAWE